MAEATGYNSDGTRRSSTVGGDTTTYELDANGNTVEIVQPEQNSVVQTFTDDDLLATRTEDIGGGGSRVTSFGYDGSGNKTSETVETGSTVGREVEYRYQAAGWLMAEINAAAPSEAITYGHNIDGTMASATDTTGQVDTGVTLEWDLLGRQTSQDTTVGGVAFSDVDTTYRADGEVASSSTLHAGSTTSTTNTYAAGASRPDTASATVPGGIHAVDYSWAATGQLDGVAIGSVTVEDRLLRADGAVLETVTSSGTHRYTVDGHGRLLGHDASGLGGPDQDYGYDAAGRVTSDGTNTYGFDANSNRTLVENPDIRTDSTYRPDNSLQAESTEFLDPGGLTRDGTYPIDAAGRRRHPFLHDVTWAPSEPTGAPPALEDCVYSYDFLNRTTGFDESAADGCVNPDDATVENYTRYLHDPLGNQIAQITANEASVDLAAILSGGLSGGTFTAPTLTGDEQVTIDVRVYLPDETLARTHTTEADATTSTVDVVFYEAGGRVLHRDDDGTTSTQLAATDGRGNITTITDTAGAVVCERFYTPFGTEADGSDCDETNTGNRRWYRGGQQDDTTGTYRYGSRHYDPATGTWTTPDTARPAAPLSDLSIGTDPLTQN